MIMALRSFLGAGQGLRRWISVKNFASIFLKPEFWKLVSAKRLTASRTLKKHMFSDLDVVVVASMQALGGTRCWEEERDNLCDNLTSHFYSLPHM